MSFISFQYSSILCTWNLVKHYKSCAILKMKSLILSVSITIYELLQVYEDDFGHGFSKCGQRKLKSLSWIDILHPVLVVTIQSVL